MAAHDLTAYRWGFGTNPPRVAVEKIMDHWLADPPDLTLVRLPMAVGLLPADGATVGRPSGPTCGRSGRSGTK